MGQTTGKIYAYYKDVFE